MAGARWLRVAFVAALASSVGLPFAAPAASASPVQRPQAVHRAVTQVTVTAPTNLRVTRLTATSVTFQWDHSQGVQPGCTLSVILYAVFLNGRFLGWTYLGSPVGFVAGLRPATTYELAVQGRDNCSGRMSPLSEPLIVTTPAR